MEEAAYIDNSVVENVIAPVLTRQYSVLVAISTLGKKKTAVFAKLIKSNIVYSYKASFICDPCFAAGVRVPCKHNQDFIPEWNGANSELIASLMEDNQETYMRESMGIHQEDSANCFTEKSIREMMTLPPVEITAPVRFVYVSVDPCAGSEIPDKRSSDFAIISACSPGIIIIGVDGFDATGPEDYRDRLVSHLRQIREKPMFANCTFVIDSESGTGFEANNINRIIRENFTKVVTMSDFVRKEGTLTSHRAKEEMMGLTREALDQNEIRFIEDMVTTDKCKPQLMAEFKKQFLQFERIVKPGREMGSKTSVKFTGKIDSQTKDDLCVTTQRVVRAKKRFLGEDRYIDERR